MAEKNVVILAKTTLVLLFLPPSLVKVFRTPTFPQQHPRAVIHKWFESILTTSSAFAVRVALGAMAAEVTIG